MVGNTREEMVVGCATNEKFKYLRATIGLKGTTKARLDKNRAPGQCYDGFICQLVDLWEKAKEERLIKYKI